MSDRKYASLDSQLGNSLCDCEDTEEMFWLRESDDYESKVKLGNLLSSQYRFREAIDAFRSAGIIRNDDPMLYVRLGGAYLTLGQFEEAEAAYKKSAHISGSDKAVLFPMGVWHYLNKDYKSAAESFVKVFPCEDEMAIAVMYWNALCCVRSNSSDELISTYNNDMKVGHHTAYRDVVEMFAGKVSSDDILNKAMNDINDLNAVIAMYGVSVYFESCGKNKEAEEVRKILLERESVWPCISYLAAWNDINGIIYYE